MKNKQITVGVIFIALLIGAFLAVGRVLLVQWREIRWIEQQAVNSAQSELNLIKSIKAQREAIVRYDSLISEHEKRITRSEQWNQLLNEKMRLADEEMLLNNQQLNITQKYLGIAPDAASIANAKNLKKQ